MRIALIFENLIGATTGFYFHRACQALGVTGDHWRLRDAASIPRGYDLYLRVDNGDGYGVRLPAHCRPAVFYAIDTHLPHSWRKIRRMAPQFDALFCCHADAVSRLPRAEWLPVACDPQIHGVAAGQAQWDIGFVGTEGGIPRKFYLQALRERYPKSCLGGFDYTEMAGIYGRSRIGFNYSIADDVNMRMFEVMAGGALLVTNALDSDDLQQLGFEDRTHLVLYRSPQELFGVIEEFLADEPARRRLAAAGQRLTLERHTYVHRMRQLLSSASKRLFRPSAKSQYQVLSEAGKVPGTSRDECSV